MSALQPCENKAAGTSKTPFERQVDSRNRNPYYIEESHDGLVRVMFIIDAAGGHVTPYYLTTHGTEKENFAALKDYIEHMESHGLEVKIVRSDNELFTRRIL